MAFQNIWYESFLPDKIIEALEEDLKKFDKDFSTGVTYGGVDLKTRDSKTCWIPANHWICGMCYHYILSANKTNFNYDITGFDHDQMQYTSYSEGEYYNWHVDGGMHSDGEYQRKLSIIVQLSDPSDYEGGEVQIMNEDGTMQILPKVKGSIIVFDSRAKHRVRKIYEGNRKSLVGWIVGPRWR